MNVVYGGSFNPPSLAHYYIAKHIISNYKVDNFLFLPVGNNYNKSSLIFENDRLNMVKILADKLGCKVLENEINKEFRGTYISLKEIEKDYKDIYFIMGADNLMDLKKWLNLDKLLNEFNFFIISRSDIDVNSIIKDNFGKYENKFHIINLNLDISSTKIRENIKESKKYLLDEVYEYIIKHNLYKE